jgi:hypothetical protein
MRRTILTLSIAAALAAPGLASGTSYAPKHWVAKSACKQARSDDKDAFRERYANENGKHAFRRCVRQHVRYAKKYCRAERKDDKQAFREKYADNDGTGAFQNCVYAHEDEGVVAEPAST